MEHLTVQQSPEVMPGCTEIWTLVLRIVRQLEDSRSLKKVLGHLGKPKGNTGLEFGGIEKNEGWSLSFKTPLSGTPQALLGSIPDRRVVWALGPQHAQL